MFTISIIKGDTSNITVTFTDENSTAIDLTGSTVFFTVKKALSDSDDNALIKKDITSHTDAVNGITEIILTPTDTSINSGSYKADLQIKNATGDIMSTEVGTVTVTQDVTIRTS